MATCVVTRALPGTALERLRSTVDVVVWDSETAPTAAELIELVRDADALIPLVTDRIDSAVLGAAPRLRVVANYGVGYDNVDVAEAERLGITVSNTPDVLTDATADLAFALMAAAARHITEGDRMVRDGRWRGWEPRMLLGVELKGARVAVIGTGRIGSAFAERASGYGMHVETFSRRGTRSELLDLLSRSDVVSLHCPLTPESYRMIDEEAIRTLGPHAIVVNTARGGLVDLEALATALQEDRIGAVAIDVADEEPIPLDHPILRAPRATITPHIGSATSRAREAMADLAVDNVLAVIAGKPALTPVYA